MENRRIGIALLVILLAGIALAVILVRRPTQTGQEASQTANINTGGKITQTNNKDNTMGAKKNYSQSLSGSSLGSLTVSVTDVSSAPSSAVSPGSEPSKGIQKVRSLVLRIDRVEVHLIQAGGKSIDKWETLAMPLPMSVDLAQVSNGLTTLSLDKVSGGKYSEVRVYIEGATAILENGKVISPGIMGKDNIVRVTQDFTVDSGKNTNVVLGFNAQKSLEYDGSQYVLKPFVVKLTVNK